MIALICLAILLYGAFRGWRNGLLREVISFTGFFIGLYLAYRYYEQVGFGVFGFLLIWIIVPLTLGFVAWMITKLLDEIIVIGTVNKLLGAAVGFLKYALLLGCLMMLVDYVREVKSQVETNPLVQALKATPKYLFPNVSEEVNDGGEEK